MSVDSINDPRPPTMSPRQILDLAMLPDNDAGAATVRDYLVALTSEVWDRVDAFNGKRPFGNSGWVWDLYGALVQGGATPGRMDEEEGWGVGDLPDREGADRMIAEAIQELGNPPPAPRLPDGGLPFVSLLLRLGVSTRDGRTLSADGKFELPTDAPLLKVVDETVPHSPSDTVGRIVGLWRVDHDIYAVGVADPEFADALNGGELVLAADMDAHIAEVLPRAEVSSVTIASGLVRGARLRKSEDFAWTI